MNGDFRHTLGEAREEEMLRSILTHARKMQKDGRQRVPEDEESSNQHRGEKEQTWIAIQG